MKYKPYELYKDSEIKWLGKIPSHWDIFPVQYALKPIANNNIGDNWSNTQLLSLTLKGIVQRDIDSGKGKSHSDYSTYQKITKGDFVFCLFDIEETPRTVGLSNLEGMITSAYTALKPTSNIDSKFIYYLFESIDNFKGFGSEYSGMRKTIRPSKFLKLRINIPTINEQTKITKFLDKETLKINNLISKQEKLITLLEEQRKSIISHAVTKGLNPNAPMKDSGVEWLGEIPEHWRILRTKDILNHRNENALENDEIITCFRDGEVTLRKNRRTDGFTNAIQEHGYQHIHSGDLVIHEMDAFAGAIGVSDSDGKSTPVYTVLFPKEIPLNIYFYSDFFRTMARQGFITSLGKGIRVRSTEFRWKESKNVYVVLPPFAEQNEIVDYIQSETKKINNLINKQKLLIEKLQEYRSSIISHAVTGKIDVREAL